MNFKTLQTTLFISLLIAASGGFLWLVHDYLLPIFWAVVLAILFQPIERFVARRFKLSRTLSAVATLLITFVVVFVPLYLIGALIAREAVDLYYQISWPEYADGFDLTLLLGQATSILEMFRVDITALEGNITSFVQNLSASVGAYALAAGEATFNTLLKTFVMLYVLFFLLRDGEATLKRIKDVLPLGDAKEALLIEKFASIVRAMLKGTFLVALVQGVLGGILFAVAGISSAAIWGFAMAVASVIPSIGAAIIWLPAGVILLALGATWQGILVLVFGGLVISTIDNILRPMLVGKETAMPDVLVLLSVFGGITLFGFAGIIIGPVITAFFLSMWQLFEHDYAVDLARHG